MRDQENADSTIGASQSGAQTGGAQAGAGQATQGAAASTGASQAGAGAQGNLAQEETVSDVGQGEAYIINMKRLVAQELDLDAQLRQITVAIAQRLARNAEDFDAQIRKMALDSLLLGQQALANSVALANRVNNSAIDLDTRIKSDGASSDSRRQDNAETHDKQMDAISVSERERTVRGGDAGDVIRWAGLSENPVFQDAISAAVASGFEKATTKIVNK